MTNVLLLQLDGSIPNLALMRIAAHHRAQGDSVQLLRLDALKRTDPRLLDRAATIYASAVFKKTGPFVERLRQLRPDAIIGGTGTGDIGRTLENVGIPTRGPLDYGDFPSFTASLGFTQRGCRLRCSFCVVPRKEGRVREEQTIAELWRGEPYPRHLLLLDNDFFGQPHWRERMAEIRDGGFKVSLMQGVNVRMLTDETAEAIASVQYSHHNFKRRLLFTAWDNRKDEERLFRGLRALVRYGVRPADILVYMLIGYWPGETEADWEYRRAKLRAFGALPYPMPYVRNYLTAGFQRFCLGGNDRRYSWAQWKAQRCQPQGWSKGPRVRQPRSNTTVQVARTKRLARTVDALGTHGGARKGEAFKVIRRRRSITLKRGTSAAYRIARLKRDFPALAEALARGEFASVSAAWRAADALRERRRSQVA